MQEFHVLSGKINTIMMPITMLTITTVEILTTRQDHGAMKIQQVIHE
jgi:hypothetical protein